MSIVETTTDGCLQAALEYVGYGWRAVPLHSPTADGGCTCRSVECELNSHGKHPRMKEWQTLASSVEEVVCGWWTRWPGTNVGVQFGPESGIIDIEADNEEEERLYLELFDGDPPVTPTFSSGRGKHRLFKYRADLPQQAVFKYRDKLGMRIGAGKLGAQSVFPPSRHHSGAQYRWLVPPSECDVAEITDKALAKLWNEGGETGASGNGDNKRKPVERFKRIIKGVPEGSRDSAMLSYIGHLLAGARNVRDDDAMSVLLKSALAVNERNEPPLPEEKVERHFCDTLEKERKSREGNGQAEKQAALSSDLPQIDAGIQSLPRLAAKAWAAIQQANEPPRLFRFGGAPVRIESGDHGEPITKDLGVDRMRHEVARAAVWVQHGKRESKCGGNETTVEEAKPPVDVVRDMLAAPDIALPPLVRIVEAPVFGADGSLQTAPGYHPSSQTFYAPAAGFVVPDVPEKPTPEDVAHALDLIGSELLGDFPFVSDAERANAISLLLLPFALGLIDDCTPLHLVEKPTPGTGATLLVDMLAYPAAGRPLAAMTEGRDEDEWRKRVTAKLRSGANFVLIDNLRNRLDSAAVSSAITSPTWEDRVLGASEMVRTPVRCVWVATGNNPAVSSEIARRTIRIRLDAKQDQPWRGRDFRHPDIRGWAREHRGQLVWAALVLIRAWLAAGRPPGGERLGMFERWAATMGGILQVAGVPAFLANLDEFYEDSDAEGAALREFIQAWWARHKDHSVGVTDLYVLAERDATQISLGDGGDRSQRIRLGKLVGRLRGRVYTIERPGDEGEEGVNTAEGARTLTVRVEKGSTFRRAQTWHLRGV